MQVPTECIQCNHTRRSPSSAFNPRRRGRGVGRRGGGMRGGGEGITWNNLPEYIIVYPLL